MLGKQNRRPPVFFPAGRLFIRYHFTSFCTSSIPSLLHTLQTAAHLTGIFPWNITRHTQNAEPAGRPQGTVYAAGDRGCPAAFWGIRQDRDAWELEYFYVAEERLGRGLGKQMWEHMIGWCGKQGIGRIQFVTSPQAVGFYRKMGAVQDGETRSPVDGRPVPRFVYDV